MKHAQTIATGLALTTLFLAACTEAEPVALPAKVAQQAPASAPAAAPAETPVAAAPAAAPASAKQPAAAEQEPAMNPATNPAFARGGPERYKGSLENTLQTPQDVSKLKLADDGGHGEGDGHDHGNAVPQDGRSLLPAAQAERNRGRIELASGFEQTHDLGKMRQGEKASYDFQFVSQGDDALVISGVKPSCGCTKAEIALLNEDGTHAPYTKGDPIPVGQKFVLESEISTDGKPGGPFNAQISIYGNDIRGAFNVRLTATIEPVLTITPNQTVFFGHMTTADTNEQTILVTATQGEHFLLTLGQEAVQEPLNLKYEAKNPDAEGKSNEWQIQVKLGPNCKIGMNSYPVQFKTDIPIAHPKYPSPDGSPQNHGFMLNVQAQVSGMVSAEPSFLTFGMVRPGEPLERSLRIECHDDFVLKADIPVSIEGLQGQEFPYKDAFDVVIEPEEGGKAATLKVKLRGLPEDLNGSFGGVFRVKVSHPYLDELQVRFSGVCRPGLPQQQPR